MMIALMPAAAVLSFALGVGIALCVIRLATGEWWA